jgi:hypothetical protein
MLHNIRNATSGGDLAFQNETLWYKNYPMTLGLDQAQDYQDTRLNYDVYEEYGSKWFEISIDSEKYEDGKGVVYITGCSAWSPVSPLFLKLSEKYQLKIESAFEECGSDFGGYFNCSNGEVTRDETFEWRVFRYIDDNDYYIETMFEELEDGQWESLEDFKEVHKSEVFQFTAEEWADINDYFSKK